MLLQVVPVSFLIKASFCRPLLYLWLPGKSCVQLHTKEDGSVCLGHDLILQPQFGLFLSGGKGEEIAVCFASIYLEAPVQCPLLIRLMASWILQVAVVVCSGAFQIARSSACSVFETLFDKVVRISLM